MLLAFSHLLKYSLAAKYFLCSESENKKIYLRRLFTLFTLINLQTK